MYETFPVFQLQPCYHMISSLFNWIADHPVIVFALILIPGVICLIATMFISLSRIDYDNEDTLNRVTIASVTIAIPGIFGAIINYPWTAAGIGTVIVLCYLLYVCVKGRHNNPKTSFLAKHFGVM